MNLHVMDVDLQTVEISWSPLRLSLPLMIQHPNQTYTLSVISSNTQPHIVQIYERSYIFTAPEGAPPCEVYNISVLTMYHEIAGTTYTGDGCNVATPVFQRMLPSRPNISNLESYLSFVLKKNATGQVTLKVFFPVSIMIQESEILLVLFIDYYPVTTGCRPEYMSITLQLMALHHFVSILQYSKFFLFELYYSCYA